MKGFCTFKKKKKEKTRAQKLPSLLSAGGVCMKVLGFFGHSKFNSPLLFCKFFRSLFQYGEQRLQKVEQMAGFNSTRENYSRQEAQ